MAKPEECAYYGNGCGFARWRRDGVNLGATPLAEDGDCGIPLQDCQRLSEEIPGIPLDAYGPATWPEMDVSFPEIQNENGRPPKRIVGGAHR